MSESSLERKEIDAFLSFLATFKLTQTVQSVADLSDGTALFEVLCYVDADYFRQPNRPSLQLSENWVLQFSTLKRLYRLMTQYITNILQKSTTSLDVPDLQSIAKDHDLTATLAMCRLTIAIGVQCEKNKLFIERIQGLTEANQHYLMKAIEQVMLRINLTSSVDDSVEQNMTEDDHYYRMQSQRSQVSSERDILQKVHEALIEEHRNLQTSFDDVVQEKNDIFARLRELSEAEIRRNDKVDGMMRLELERLRSELQKSEDNLSIAESELEKHAGLVSELGKKVEDLQSQSILAEKLKDQLDEYRHAADKLQKTENVMEKYKKKLQEGTDLRQRVKALEKQNADLVNRIASQEEEYRKVTAFKPLMESYKNQISDLESKTIARSQEIETLKFDLEQSRTKLKIMAEERAKDAETLELYQERVRELEITSHKTLRSFTNRNSKVDCPESSRIVELDPSSGDYTSEVDSDDHAGLGLDGELDDAIAGTTMTDLKLKIRKLTRELEAVKKNDAEVSHTLVLENLLEDANRMKTRYGNDYLTAHREKLVLQRQLDEIRSGKSLGDSTEAVIALRQRLNETVEQFESLSKEHAEIQIKFESQSKELTIAKSDLKLVNRDQLDILATLRETLNEDKASLEDDIDCLRIQNEELRDKNRMQLEQINVLLLEKVNLQSEGIDQREKMLQREKDFGNLRAALSRKGIPDDVKSQFLASYEENLGMKELNKTLEEKLSRAKQLIKSQDKLLKEQQAASMKSSSFSKLFEEKEDSLRSRIKILEKSVASGKNLIANVTARYRRENELILGTLINLGTQRNRINLGGSYLAPANPSSWLGIQRKNFSCGL